MANLLGSILVLIICYVVIKHLLGGLGKISREVHGAEGEYPGRKLELLVFRVCAVVLGFMVILMLVLSIKRG